MGSGAAGVDAVSRDLRTAAPSRIGTCIIWTEHPEGSLAPAVYGIFPSVGPNRGGSPGTWAYKAKPRHYPRRREQGYQNGVCAALLTTAKTVTAAVVTRAITAATLAIRASRGWGNHLRWQYVVANTVPVFGVPIHGMWALFSLGGGAMCHASKGEGSVE
jgi:hypothetical protein